MATASTLFLDYLLAFLASIEGIRDLGHDLGIGNPTIRFKGRYEVGAFSVAMKADRGGSCEVASSFCSGFSCCPSTCLRTSKWALVMEEW